jgi:photosystem II stability/assembly factor-like uncharacterized protein
MPKTRILVGLIFAISLISTSCSDTKSPGAWTQVETGTGDAFYSVSFINGNEGWLNGQTDRDYTPPDDNSNGNRNGDSNSKGNSSANKPTAANKNAAASGSGKKAEDPLKANQGFEVLHTTDGGKTWAPIKDLFKNKIRSVWFVDAQTGWAITIDRNILKTTDGGTNWAFQRQAGTVKLKLIGNRRQPEMDQPDQIERIRFIDKVHGWAWGGGQKSDYTEQPGILLTTVNGGQNWNQVPYPFEQNVLGMFFLDAMHGWASTVTGLYRSTDGGLNWNKIQTKLPEIAFDSMGFVNDHTGVVVGRSGRMDRTTDGGQTWWKLVDIKPQFVMRDICFSDAKRGWAVGDNGSILYTPDAGENWLSLDSPVTSKLMNVQFIGDRIGWAAGLEGAVLKFEPK